MNVFRATQRINLIKNALNTHPTSVRASPIGKIAPRLEPPAEQNTDLFLIVTRKQFATMAATTDTSKYKFNHTMYVISDR